MTEAQRLAYLEAAGVPPDRLCAAARGKTALYQPCSHVWIDPSEPMIQRAPYSPVIGPKRREMKRGTIYECQNCGARLRTDLPSRDELRARRAASV